MDLWQNHGKKMRLQRGALKTGKDNTDTQRTRRVRKEERMLAKMVDEHDVAVLLLDL
jgi:hypothetical protein